MPRHWLLKSDADSYSLDDLERDRSTHWDGVRNYQARNLLRDELRTGDRVLFYHSGGTLPGVAGTAAIVRDGYPDPSALDPASRYFDPRAGEEVPRWFMVDVEFVERFTSFVPLQVLKSTPGLEKMLVVSKSRLSVQPVTPEEYAIVTSLGHRPRD